MKLLALETSGRQGSLYGLAVSPAAPSLGLGVSLPAGQRSAQSLGPAIQRIFQELDWKATDLDAVAVTSGPGSFTGLRVGVTAAKMLAFVAQCPVVEVDTLAVLAAQAAAPECPVWAILDAQRRELFAARYDSSGGLPTTEVLPIDAFRKRLQPGDLVTGPIVPKLELPSGVRATPEECWTPQAETVAQLAAPKAAAGEVLTPERLVPRYYRLSAAEEKRLKQEQSS